MLWAIFSDVHANGPALEAVLAAIEKEKPDRLLCLGDLVGYGPHPSEVLERIRELDCPVIGGNHDLAAVDLLDASCFNPYARAAVEWTAEQLSQEEHDYLRELPLVRDDGPIAAVHGTRDAPEEFLYLQTTEHAADLLDDQPRFLGVFGHTHVPLSFLQRNGEVTVTFSTQVDLTNVDRALVNVGSVGQPRDEDSRAAFVLFDEDQKRLDIRRVTYDVDSVAADITAAGLPQLLADRLRFGV